MRMRRHSPIAALLVVLLVTADGHRVLSQSEPRSGGRAPARTLPGPAAPHAVDPCDHDPPGLARGRDRLCVPRGSSSGIARGDFNGDGIGDLAIGVPFEDVNGIQDAGGVNVIYGSPSGLHAATFTPGLGSAGNQVWTQNSPNIEGVAEAGDQFGRVAY